MQLYDYIIFSQNKQDNSRLCTILDYHPPKVCCRHCYKTLSHLTINTTSSKKLTPQVDQEPWQYRLGHDWYSKFIRLEHEHRMLKFWTKFLLCTMKICWLPKSKKLESIVPNKTRPWRHDAIQQTIELNIVAIDDQKDHKIGKLTKEKLSPLN